MKEKIINTKNVLKIIMLVLIIFSTIKSCSKAFTFEQFIDFCNTNYDLCSTNCKNQINWLNSNKNDILTKFNTSDNIDNYDSFFLMAQNNYQLYLVAFKNTTRWYANSNTINVYGGIITSITKYPGNSIYKAGSSNVSSSGYNLSNQQASIGLMSIDAEDDKYGNFISNNYYIKGLEFTPYNNEVVSTNVNAIKNIYRYSVVSLGQITNYSENDRYNYVELLQNNNIVANMTYNNISKRLNNSYNMDIESNDNGDIIRVNNWVLYLDELYTLNIYSGRRKCKQE